MTKKRLLVGMFGIILTFGLVVLVGCNNGSTGGGNNNSNSGNNTAGGSNATVTSARWENSGGIRLYTSATNENWWKVINDSEETRKGFSVTANGVSKKIEEVIGRQMGTVEIWFEDDYSLPSTTVIKLSYDGTGNFAGKIKPFSNLTVPYSTTQGLPQ
jgi:hypothetical protein